MHTVMLVEPGNFSYISGTVFNALGCYADIATADAGPAVDEVLAPWTVADARRNVKVARAIAKLRS